MVSAKTEAFTTPLTTTMSNKRLPAELLDLIVGLLYDSRDALKSCCLVSKSWIPRARRYLFANVEFSTETDLQLWKTTFPDSSTSPARYTKALLLKFPQPGAAGGGWISTFTRVVRFEVDAFKTDLRRGSQFVPFHGFSLDIKSLRLTFYTIPSSQVFNLIYSFPHLDDLAVTGFNECHESNDAHDGQATVVQSLAPPSLTGSLELDVWVQADFMISRLLSVPGGLHFRRLRLRLSVQRDASPIAALVEGCRFTLESLEVDYQLLLRTFIHHLYSNQRLISFADPPLVDLSKATHLKDIAFVCKSNPKWITASLRTITHNHRNFQRVSIVDPELLYHSSPLWPANPAGIIHVVGETAYREWLELDRLLTKLSESHSIRPEVLYNLLPSMDRKWANDLVESLLPELTMRGLARLTGMLAGYTG